MAENNDLERQREERLFEQGELDLNDFEFEDDVEPINIGDDLDDVIDNAFSVEDNKEYSKKEMVKGVMEMYDGLNPDDQKGVEEVSGIIEGIENGDIKVEHKIDGRQPDQPSPVLSVGARNKDAYKAPVQKTETTKTFGVNAKIDKSEKPVFGVKANTASVRKVYVEAAFLNVDDKGHKSVSLGLRTSIQGNEKGGNSFPVTTLSKNGKPGHFVTLSANMTKTGANKDTREIDRFLEASNLQAPDMDEKFEELSKNLEGKKFGSVRLPSLEKQGFAMNAFNSKESGEKNAIYYTDNKGSFVPGKVKEGNSYKPNPNASRARIANIEQTIHKDLDFDIDKEVALRKEYKETKNLIKNVDNTPKAENKEVSNDKGAEMDMF